ncbi:hypothetical protein ABZX51_002638 [Aspergillus tubingensis]
MDEATPSASQSSPFEAGIYLPGGHNTDPPLTTDTVGYRLNHFMLRIRDPQRTLHFYIDLMGMRTIFTMNAGPFTMYYLGYPPTPSDRADLYAWASRVANVRELTQTIGLLEFYHTHGTEKDKEFRVSTGNLPPNLGFGHLGFTVPDVPAAVERLRGQGVHVLKEVGDSSRGSVPLSAWEEHRGLGTGDVHPKFKEIYDQIACVADPVGRPDSINHSTQIIDDCLGRIHG